MLCTSCKFENPSGMRFCGQCGTRLAGADAPPIEDAVPEGGQRQTPRVTEERRQITVGFFDLVGSTALSDRLDPEDYRALVRAYHQLVAREVERLDGRVAQYLGDGVMAYFGHPRAREDAAERAVRAALAVVGELKTTTFRQETPEIRVGIHTGLVVVSRMGDGGALALGSTPNVAARIQSLAEANTLLISQATHRLVRTSVTAHNLGPKHLKGISRPMDVYRVEDFLESRDSAQQDPFTRSRMVDRRNERAELSDLWIQARQGKGCCLLIQAEAGMGKTRLVGHFLDTELQGAREFVASCAAHRSDSALSPLAALLEKTIGPVANKQNLAIGLRRVLARAGLPEEAFHVLFDLMRPQPSVTGTLGELSPKQLRKKTLEHLSSWLFASSREQPIVILIEDIHWADPSTLEWLASFQQELEHYPVLMLVTSRPGRMIQQTDWRPQHVIELTRLGTGDVKEMIDSLSSDRTLPPEVTRRLLETSDGVPLYVEELSQMLLERLQDQPLGDGSETSQEPDVEVPSTLHDLLMARLDRLGEERDLVQWASTIGRTVNVRLMTALLERDLDAVRAQLEQLVAKGILEPIEDGDYRFRHALVKETAYHALLKTDRIAKHLHVAKVLMETLDSSPESGSLAVAPESIAFHLDAGGHTAQAASWWLRAGERGLRQSANLEAIAHLEKASACAEAGDDVALELRIAKALASGLVAVRGYGSGEVEEVYDRVCSLARASGNPREIFFGLRGVLPFYLVRGDHTTAKALGEELLLLAQKLADEPLRVEAHLSYATACFWLGEVTEAHQQAKQALALSTDLAAEQLDLRFGQDPVALAELYCSWCTWWLGSPVKALEAADRAITRARGLGHLHTLVLTLDHAAALALYLGLPDWAQELAKEQADLAEQHDFEMWLAMGRYRMALLQAQRPEAPSQAALDRVRASIAAFRATGALIAQPLHLFHLALANRSFGQEEEAYQVLGTALEAAQRSDERHWLSEIYRLRGDILLVAKETHSEGLDALRQATLLARNVGSPTLELRALVSLQAAAPSKESHLRLQQLLSKHPDLAVVSPSVPHGLSNASESLRMGIELPDAVAAKRILAQSG